MNRVPFLVRLALGGLVLFGLQATVASGQSQDPVASEYPLAEERTLQEEFEELQAPDQSMEAWAAGITGLMGSLIEDTTQRFSIFQGQFVAALAFVTLLSFGASVQQLYSSRKGREDSDRRFQLIQRQSDRYEQFIEEQAMRNKELLDTSRSNIEQITSLLGSLEQLFNFTKTAEEMKADVERLKKDIDENESEAQNRVVEKARELNTEAIQISRQLNRSNYKNEEFKERIRGFRNQLNRSGLRSESSELLNPNVFYLLALDLIVRSLFDQGREEFDHAIALGKSISKSSPSDVDTVLFPEEALGADSVPDWNKKLVNICLFHKAIVLYNLGEYTEAEELFREAVLDFDPNDAKATMYIPEAKYLAGVESFQAVERSFRSAERRIRKISDTRGWSQTKDALLAQLHSRLGNIYFPSRYKKNYGESANLDKALGAYRKAYKLDPHSYISKFSYGQALAARAKLSSVPSEERNECRRQAVALLEEVLELLKVRIGETTEAKILVMLYYMVAICCKITDVEHAEETIDRYLSKMWEQTGRFVSIVGYRIFSPLSKSDLTVAELQEEIRAVF